MKKSKITVKKLFSDKKFIIILIILIVLIVAGIFIYNKRYSPTYETMSLNDYYEVAEGEMALIVDGELIPDKEGAARAIVRDNTPYVRYDVIGDAVDDVYAYDPYEKKISYTTVDGTYKASVGAKGYTINGNNKGTDYVPVIEANGTGYVALGFVRDTNGCEYTFDIDPARAALYTPGTERTTAEINGDTELRRFGGNRSKVVGTVKKGAPVTLVENYGSWSQVLTSDGILGCVANGYISDRETSKNPEGAAQKSLKHHSLGKTVRLGWNQVFSSVANGEVNSMVEAAPGMNVISPTWLIIKDNRGNLTDMSSANYVNYCHSKGLSVWVLVNNIERDIDESALFNSASSRENLVNNIINSVMACGADGVNVDMEAVGDTNVDGYVEFIKELAVKCNEKGLIISVDNYNLSSANYKVGIQAKYADYIILLGYDETWTGSPTAGSNNSMGFVKKGMEGMLDAGVDKSQLILAIPFYTRIWNQTGSTLTSDTIAMKDINGLLSSTNATTTWLKDNKENYAEWTDGSGTHMMWIVDNKSLKERLSYVADKGIAGIAAWRLGYETRDTWQMISDTVH